MGGTKETYEGSALEASKAFGNGLLFLGTILHFPLHQSNSGVSLARGWQPRFLLVAATEGDDSSDWDFGV